MGREEPQLGGEGEVLMPEQSSGRGCWSRIEQTCAWLNSGRRDWTALVLAILAAWLRTDVSLQHSVLCVGIWDLYLALGLASVQIKKERRWMDGGNQLD